MNLNLVNLNLVNFNLAVKSGDPETLHLSSPEPTPPPSAYRP